MHSKHSSTTSAGSITTREVHSFAAMGTQNVVVTTQKSIAMVPKKMEHEIYWLELMDLRKWFHSNGNW
jgi:hypothetical protein